MGDSGFEENIWKNAEIVSMSDINQLFPPESIAMRAARWLGFERIAWALRRVYCPVPADALVLDLGSGGNPHYRANILCDAYLETVERFFEKLVADRPIVLAMAEQLPFKNGTFDFVIASHVLEHSKDPEKFISELQRVGKAGYIEVPDAFFERLFNYPFHMLEITDKNGELLIRKKKGTVEDPELWNLFENKVFPIFSSFVSRRPFHFHVRYYWSQSSGGIKYKILNPQYKFDWNSPEELGGGSPSRLSVRTRIYKAVLLFFRKFLSQNARNRAIANTLDKYLMCLSCGGSIVKNATSYTCATCGHSYPIISHGVVNFMV